MKTKHYILTISKSPLTVLVTYFFVTSVVFATSYYISPTGNDSNNGTSALTPWCTISKVNNYLFQPNDIIQFQGGQQFHGNLIVTNSGMAGHPITITSYGAGRAELLAGTGDGILLHNNQYISVTNIKIVGSGISNGGFNNNGINILEDNNQTRPLNSIYISQVEVSGFRQTGIEFGNNSGAGYNDLRFRNCDVHDNGDVGMWSYSYTGVPTHTNIITAYCNFHDNPGISDTNSGSGMFYKNVDGGVIERCVAYNNGALSGSSSGPAGLWCLYSNNIVLQLNESYNNHSGTAGADGDGIDLDLFTTNCVVQYNYTHENDGPGILIFGSGQKNNTVRYNISQNDCRTTGNASIWVSGGPQDGDKIYNNTVYLGSYGTRNSSYLAAIKFSTGSLTNIRIANNIFETANGVPLVRGAASATSGVSFNGNDYWNQSGSFSIYWNGNLYTSLSAWKANASQENRTGYEVAPLLSNAGGAPLRGNLLSNPGFEIAGWWSASGSAGIVNSNAHTGSYSMAATSGNDGAWQWISVNPNTTYTLTAWGKKDSTLANLMIFVKTYGGGQICQYFTSTSYAQNSITFTPTSTSCIIGVWAWNGSGYGYADDFVLSGGTLNAYKLQCSSMMIDHGLDLMLLYGINPGYQDFYGDILPQRTTYDIGADELPPCP